MARKAAARGARKAAPAKKAASAKKSRARKTVRASGRDDVSDNRRKQRAARQEESSKKSGCAPKLFVLLLPLATAGTYLLLKS